MSDSYWVIPEVESVSTPLSILKDVSNELTRRTEGLLRGHASSVRPKSDPRTLIIDFDILVPALDDYIVEVIRYYQPLAVYPGLLEFRIPDNKYEIKNEGEFLGYIRPYLSSAEMQNVIGSLLAQSRTMSEKA